MVFMLLLVALKVDERQDTSKTWQSEKEGEREKGGEREREREPERKWERKRVSEMILWSLCSY